MVILLDHIGIIEANLNQILSKKTSRSTPLWPISSIREVNMEQKMKSEHIDPLVVIFEKYVYDFPSESLDQFIETIVNEYLNFLSTQNVVVPEKNRPSLLKDLV